MEQEQYDLVQLYERRSKVNAQLIELEAKIRKESTQLFSKSSPKGKPATFMTQFERALAIYDGVMIGYKLYRRFSGVLKFFRKKKNKR